MVDVTKITDLFNGPVRDYAHYDNVRSVPSMVDGFKVSQRKAIFGAVSRYNSIPKPQGIKVAQLTSACAELSAYAHGEGSMAGTIVSMAQDFAGSNNMNWFMPIGQFGSRISPIAGAARYIYTDLSPVFRKIFLKVDDQILEHLEDDGDPIEPRYYLPIIPTVLLNGAEGIGTGFSSKILSYNPVDLKKHCLDLLEGRKPKRLTPWYRGYHGKVEKDFDTGRTTFTGTFKRINTTTIEIDEVPLWTYEEKYKEHLIKLEDSGFIKSFDSLSTSDRLIFRLTVPRTTSALPDEELIRRFKLVARESENITVWTPEGKIERYADPEHLVKDFIEFRLEAYEKRRLKQIEVLEYELNRLLDRQRFIRFYLSNRTLFTDKTKAELIHILTEEKFSDPDSLLAIRLYSLTKDEIEKLQVEVEEGKTNLELLKTKTATDLYVADLKALDLKGY